MISLQISRLPGNAWPLPRLRLLDLSDNLLVVLDTASFDSLPHLQYLNVSQSRNLRGIHVGSMTNQVPSDFRCQPSFPFPLWSGSLWLIVRFPRSPRTPSLRPLLFDTWIFEAISCLPFRPLPTSIEFPSSTWKEILGIVTVP